MATDQLYIPLDREAFKASMRELLLEILGEMPNKEVYSEKEFCELVGISKDTAKKLRDKGELHFKQVGRRVLYSRQHIQDFLSN